jgi:hypothetical protein
MDDQPPINHEGRIMARPDRESITREPAELSNVRCRSFNQRATQGTAAATVGRSLSGDHRWARGSTRRHTPGADCVSQRLSRVAGGGLLQRPAQVTDCVPQLTVRQPYWAHALSDPDGGTTPAGLLPVDAWSAILRTGQVSPSDRGGDGWRSRYDAYGTTSGVTGTDQAGGACAPRLRGRGDGDTTRSVLPQAFSHSCGGASRRPMVVASTP